MIRGEMITDVVEAPQVLQDIRSLLIEHGWHQGDLTTQGAWAIGQPIPHCLEGARMAVQQRIQLAQPVSLAWGQRAEFAQAGTALRRVIGGRSLATWNDQVATAFWQVAKALDEAALLAKEWQAGLSEPPPMDTDLLESEGLQAWGVLANFKLASDGTIMVNTVQSQSPLMEDAKALYQTLAANQIMSSWKTAPTWDGVIEFTPLSSDATIDPS
jgi:hypothetical protein